MLGITSQCKGWCASLFVDMFTRLQSSTDGKDPAADVNGGCCEMTLYVITVPTGSLTRVPETA